MSGSIGIQCHSCLLTKTLLNKLIKSSMSSQQQPPIKRPFSLEAQKPPRFFKNSSLITDLPFVKFSGVVIKPNHKIASTRSIAYITTRQEEISIDPVNGQQWLVTGDYSVKEIEHGDYIMYAVEFDHPKLEVTLPNTNELLFASLLNKKILKESERLRQESFRCSNLRYM